MNIATFQRDDLLNRHEKKIRSLLYAIVTYTIGINFLNMQSGGSAWKTGDWLINYEGGFVRRGLFGEILYLISPDGWLLFLTFAIKSIIYLAICHFTLEEFFSKKRGLLDGVIIFSPAFIFLFPFYTTNAGMRKELLAFLSFILLLEATKKKKNNILLLLSLFFFTLGIFSHETIALFLFFYIYTFLKRSTQPLNQKISYISLLTSASLSGLYLSFIYHGDISTANSIYTSLALKGIDYKMSEGAISALSGTTLSSISWVESELPRNYIYLPLFVLSFLPAAFIKWKNNSLIIILGFISILPLFIFAVDWGRWIHIYITFIFLFYIYNHNLTIKLNINKPLLIFFLFYLIAWRLPHFKPDAMKVSGAFMIPYHIYELFFNIMSSFNR